MSHPLNNIDFEGEIIFTISLSNCNFQLLQLVRKNLDVFEQETIQFYT